jgi:phospholipid-binding lipoprotein MlaA
MAAIVLVAAVMSGCAATARQRAARPNPEHDPIEPLNRKVFWLNDKVDVYVLEPVATGWDRIAPDRVQRSVANFFTNLRFPIVAINDLLQGKVGATATDVGRFGVNTTIGVLGFFDPASTWGLERHSEDFGQTLGWWGVSPGPYLVLPLLGPSNPRDVGGLIGDYGASIIPFFVDQWVLFGVRAAETVNTRSLLLREVQDAKQASIDYYSFVRNAYVQRRAALVNDTVETNREQEEDLYNVDVDAQ